jgi:hypothetical protein
MSASSSGEARGTPWGEAEIRQILAVKENGRTKGSDTYLITKRKSFFKPWGCDVCSCACVRVCFLYLKGSFPLTMLMYADDELKSFANYLPVWWNCHNFAIFLAQLAVNTDDSAEIL